MLQFPCGPGAHTFRIAVDPDTGADEVPVPEIDGIVALAFMIGRLGIDG